jgi:hypothetical protein
MRIIRVKDLELESLTTNNEILKNEDAKDLKIEITKSTLVELVETKKTKVNNN